MEKAPEDLTPLQREELERYRAEWPKVLKWARAQPPIELDDLERLLHVRARGEAEKIFISGALTGLRVTAPGKSSSEFTRDVASLLRACSHILNREPENERIKLKLVQGGLTEGAEAADSVDPPQLSPRQLECLQLLNEGLDVKEIGRRLSVSPLTVAQHLKDTYRRLGVRGGRQAVAAARRLGLI